MSLSSIVLASGRSVRLVELRLSSTYDGMLEGYPCKPVNDRKVHHLRERAARELPGTPAHVVEPVRVLPDEPAGAFGPVEVLPAVTCVGLFRSDAVEADHHPVGYRSALVVGWFQATADLPSGEDADAALRSIPWEQLAQDYEL
ncbi:hypothetical protein GCM10010329_46090 [Streptomyces spiroverticillatus]|uniref:Uncharacterized protein n=1 Tax=Streptomyces finlayi TaxID=67296 RepID=A0A919CB92_9ACTN|nr:hypothetical protein [Streptomyces finlayi]GHA17794.1 hypothetical protein GCM10010329_46090 [Streptomyces spiroverticillatus]GHC99566.1 hypothetical protein GCM10010334_43260 [Streptomyces finlayi]